MAADFAAPLVLPGSSSAPGSTPTESLSEEHLATIVSMGFSRDQASRALKATVGVLHSDYNCTLITEPFLVLVAEENVLSTIHFV